MDDCHAKDGTKFKEVSMSIMVAVIILIAGAVGFTAHLISKTNDSPAEQAAELILKEELGVDIDFSADAKKAQHDKQSESDASVAKVSEQPQSTSNVVD